MGKRLYSLDLLKIVATLLIVLHHYQQMYDIKFTKLNFYGGTYYLGYIVELFFIVSGFVIFPIARKISNKELSFIQFFKRRYFRLIPLLALSAVLFELLVCLYHVFSGEYYHDFHFDPIGTIATMLGIHAIGIIPQPHINNPSWYISVLLECYVLFYFSVKFANRLKIKERYIWGLIAISGLFINHYELEFPFVTSQVSRGFMGVFIGLILADLINQYQDSKARKILTISAFILCTAAMLFQFVRCGKAISHQHYFLTFIFFPILISLVTLPEVTRLLDYECIGLIGKISFDVYIWHVVVFIIPKMLNTAGICHIHFDSLPIIILLLFIAAIVGVLSYSLLEKRLYLCSTRSHGNIIDKEKIV